MAEETTPLDDPYLIALASRGLWRRFRDRLSKFFFGDDIFISYARADAAEYASSLAARLTKRRFICYLDQFGSLPDAEMPDWLKEKLIRSTSLVLIGTPKATASANVRKEIALFTWTKRAVIPVDVDGVLRGEAEGARGGEAGWKEIVGLAHIDETGERVRGGNPTPRVVNLIKNSFRYRRRNQWQRFFLLAGSSFVALTVLAAVMVSTFLIRSAQAEATLIQEEAERQVKKADEDAKLAARNESLAKSDAARYGEQANNAQVMAGAARRAEEAAVRQQTLAETGMRRAQALERQAEARADDFDRREEGSRAALIAREPGREFEALAHAVNASRPGAGGARRTWPEQVVNGLVTSVTAIDYSLPLEDPPGEVRLAVLSPDGLKVFADVAAEVYGPNESPYRRVVWDVRTGKRQTLPHDAGREGADEADEVVNYASFSRDGRRLLTIDSFSSAHIWNLEVSPPEVVKTKCVTPGSRFVKGALNSDGTLLLTISGWEAIVCEVAEGKKSDGDITSESFPTELKEAASLTPAFTPQDEPAIHGVTRTSNAKSRCASPGNGFLYYVRKKDDNCVEVKGTGNTFGGIGEDGSVVTLERLPSQDPRYSEVRVQSPAGDVQTLSGYKGSIASAAHVGKTARVLTVSEGRYLRIADASINPAYAALRGHRGAVRRILFSPDGRRILTTDKDETARVWDATTGSLRHTLPPPGPQPPEGTPSGNFRLDLAAFSPDGTRVAASVRTPAGFQLQTWDALTGRHVCRPPDRRAEGVDDFGSVSFFRGNDYVIAGPALQFFPGDSVLTVWDASTCRVIKRISLAAPYRFLSFSPGGTSVLISTRDGVRGERVEQVDLSGVDVRSEAPITLSGIRIDATPPFLLGAQLFPGGVRGLSLGNDGKYFEIWEPHGRPGARVEGPLIDLSSFAFSADGRRIASAFEGGVVVWDVPPGKRPVKPSMELPARPDPDAATPIALSPDGSRMVIAGRDGTARVYPTTPGGFFEVAKSLTRR